jgi:hypothetical protein
MKLADNFLDFLKALGAGSKFLIGALLIAGSSFVYSAVAAPPGSPYSLGETLSPTCAPGDANCTVEPPQASDDNLTDISNISADQGDILYFDGTDWTDLAAGSSGQFLQTQGTGSDPVWASAGGGGDLISTNNLSDVSSASSARSNLGLSIGSDVQAWDDDLDDIAALTPTNDYLMIGDGSDWTTVDTSSWDKDNSDDLDISGQTSETVIDDSDTLAIYDQSAAGIKKITRANFLSGVTGALTYQGGWDAASNSPSLSDGSGSKGEYYVATSAGSQDLGSGSIDFTVGDWAVHNGSKWEKLDSTNDVQSVAGKTGVVTLDSGDVGLGNVENTALSTWSGSSNITTLGTIGAGTWQGSDIAIDYIDGSAGTNGQILTTDGTAVSWENAASGGATQLSGLSDVNTATATNGNILMADGADWESVAQTDITNLGTITTGTWNGSPVDISDYTNLSAGTNISLSGDSLNVDDAFLINDGDDTTTGGLTMRDLVLNPESSATQTKGRVYYDSDDDNVYVYDGVSWVDLTDAGGDVLSTNNLSDLDSASTARSNLGLGNVENTALSTWSGSSNITTVGTIGAGAWQGSDIAIDYIDGSAGTNGQVLTTDGTGVSWENAASGSGDFSDGGDTAGADRTLGNNDNYDLGFLTNGSNRLHIENSGNVGIGTTSPGKLLDIDGTARASTFELPVPSGDHSPVVTSRTVPAGQGSSNEKTEFILFHSNDGSNGSGPDQITLRAPAVNLQTFDDDTVTDINNDSGANSRLYVGPGGNVGFGDVTNPQIDLAVGDTDTGFNWTSDGVLTLRTNNNNALETVDGSTDTHYRLKIIEQDGSGTCDSPNEVLETDSSGVIRCGTEDNSDARIKNIYGENTTYGLDSLLDVETVRYNLKKDWGEFEPFKQEDDYSIKHVGFTAQQVKEVIPDVVYDNKRGSGIKSLDQLGMMAVAYKGIGDLSNLTIGSGENVVARTKHNFPNGIGPALNSIASEDASLDNEAGDSTFAGRFFERLASWLGDSANGIKELVADQITADEVCVGDSANNQSCFTEHDIQRFKKDSEKLKETEKEVDMLKSELCERDDSYSWCY